MVILPLIVFFTPLPFTACSPGSWWCSIAYGFTASGGPNGFFATLIITSIFYAISAPTINKKVLVFFRSVLTLVAVFGALAFINERFTKPILKSQRPSHVYMLKKTSRERIIDSLYQLDDDSRQLFFSNLVKDHPNEFSEVHPRVTAHWIEESGYSFPSGHSFNAFLFAMILAYAILMNRSFPRLRQLYFLPFVWALLVAVSRVAIGAHSATDVSAGAVLGIFLGSLFLYIETTRHWLTLK